LLADVQAEKINKDLPLKGAWNLEPTLLWSITTAGNDTFSRPEIAVANDGTLCVWDWTNRTSYLFDTAGKFKKAFGKRGEGPGEMRWHLNTFFTNTKMITVDIDRLHFFTMDGTYLHSAVSIFDLAEPLFFLSENDFITGTVSHFTNGKGKISYVNLKTKKKKTIKEFTALTKDTQTNSPQITLVGVSPMVVTSYEPTTQKLYYGINNTYTIHTINLEGKNPDTFSL